MSKKQLTAKTILSLLYLQSNIMAGLQQIFAGQLTTLQAKKPIIHPLPCDVDNHFNLRGSDQNPYAPIKAQTLVTPQPTSHKKINYISLAGNVPKPSGTKFSTSNQTTTSKKPLVPHLSDGAVIGMILAASCFGCFIFTCVDECIIIPFVAPRRNPIPRARTNNHIQLVEQPNQNPQNIAPINIDPQGPAINPLLYADAA